MKQETLTGFERYGKITRRAQFLAEMDQQVSWKELGEAIEPIYPKGISEAGMTEHLRYPARLCSQYIIIPFRTRRKS